MDDRTYSEAALRTAASDLQPEKINRNELAMAMLVLAGVGGALDRFKKALVYGKDIGDPAGQNSELMAGEYAESRFAPLEGQLDTMFVDLDAVPADVTHAILGIVTEAAELAEAWIDAVSGQKPLDLVNLKEETGDLLWYMALLGRGAGFTFEQAKTANIAKLVKRYGDKFTDFAALNRDLDGERQILEKGAA